MAEISRRDFIGGVTVAALGAAAALGQTTQIAAFTKLIPFDYRDVKLTAGPLKQQFDHTLKYFMDLNEDRALKVYRQRAKLPAPGADMGGWYDPTAFAPGHSLGQWISALARFAAVTGDPAVKAKVQRLVDGLGQA